MEIPRVSLGGVHGQLGTLLEAARADGSATVVLSCGRYAVEISFTDGRVCAVTSGDAALSLEDEAVLLILGWRRDDTRSPFRREWHPNTTVDSITDDLLRAAHHAYQCEADDLDVLVRMTEPEPAPTR